MTLITRIFNKSSTIIAGDNQSNTKDHVPHIDGNFKKIKIIKLNKTETFITGTSGLISSKEFNIIETINKSTNCENIIENLNIDLPDYLSEELIIIQISESINNTIENRIIKGTKNKFIITNIPKIQNLFPYMGISYLDRIRIDSPM